MKRGDYLIGFSAFLFLFFVVLLIISSLRAKDIGIQGDYVGTETCRECHEDQYANYERSIHFLTEKRDLEIKGCEACHGPGETHVEEGTPDTIFTFRGDVPAADKTEKCLNCHNKENKNFIFLGSDHMKGSVACSGCHQSHPETGKDKLLTKEGYKLCLSCHQEITPKLALNERHRITEGMVKCTDCHKNHEQSSRTRLGGFNQEACFKCHTDKQGPYVYEHGAMRVEGCTACHDPHGSVNRHMLTHQRAAELCFSCHILASSWHIRFTPDSVCTNCHSTIHGSNLDSHFVK
jgi:DmsE family decaheme c-type cytochrome